MSKKNAAAVGEEKTEVLSLNDDRRVRTLSPGAMVAKRFFRNRIAVVGLVTLVFMFLFAFLGGILSPYDEDQQFKKIDVQNKVYAGAKENKENQFAVADGRTVDAILKAQIIINLKNNAGSFVYNGVEYTVNNEGQDFYMISDSEGPLVLCYKDVIKTLIANQTFGYDFTYNALKAYQAGEDSFAVNGKTYGLQDGGLITDGDTQLAYVGRFTVNASTIDVTIPLDFKDAVVAAFEAGSDTFTYTEADGKERTYTISYRADVDQWEIYRPTDTEVYDIYSAPSRKHWLGTDGNGMDMLTRLMYGGRVSLMVGFIVEFIATFLGVIMGGISGYFGGWVDMLIMRIVDIFYCIPSTPIIIILGAAMDATGVNPTVRMIYLMLILGFLGWPGVARMVRGQILSLREQEFMTATEACGLSVNRRIFKHLIPNVIPQLIVSCTMGLGGTIITESTLSFLGLGVKYPFASWGNIINDVNNTHVLQEYGFVWIPAGCLLLLTVLAFNLVGDGLRDAFDPRMKR